MRPADEPATRKNGSAIGQDGFEEHHPAFGMVSFSRAQGNPGTLFGSALDNHHGFVTLRVTRAMRSHSLGRDWFRGNLAPVVEVDLSFTQFSELLTSMNVGSGVPCTLRHLDGRGMPGIKEHRTEQQTVQADFGAQLHEFADRLKSKIEAARVAMRGKAPTKADRELVMGILDVVDCELRSNIPFVLEQFREATDRVVAAAKAEVDGFLTSAIAATGLKALQNGAEPVVKPTLPEDASK